MPNKNDYAVEAFNVNNMKQAPKIRFTSVMIHNFPFKNKTRSDNSYNKKITKRYKK